MRKEVNDVMLRASPSATCVRVSVMRYHHCERPKGPILIIFVSIVVLLVTIRILIFEVIIFVMLRVPVCMRFAVDLVAVIALDVLLAF